MRQLTGKQIRHLRRLGHRLQPVVMIGKEGISEALLQAIDEALERHELIKVKLQEGCLIDRREVAEMLAEKSGGSVAQVLGKTILLYREGPDRKIELPA